MIDNFWKV